VRSRGKGGEATAGTQLIIAAQEPSQPGLGAARSRREFRPTGTCGILTALSWVNNETKIPNVPQRETRASTATARPPRRAGEVMKLTYRDSP